MIDVLFVAHNRRAFTEASLAALVKNTAFSDEVRLVVYDDNSNDGTREFLAENLPPMATFRKGKFGSPVAVMNDYLLRYEPSDPDAPHLFAKIDSDTMVPPGWLTECCRVMHMNPGVDLLGIESFCPPADGRKLEHRTFEEARHIGGIGLMRPRAFITLPRPKGTFFGFTAWQLELPHVRKGWIKPSLPVFLLDRLPREPWRSLSREYFARGWQREWPLYEEHAKDLWQWWCD